MASQLLRTGIFVLGKMLVQIRQHFQAAVNEIHQIYHMFNASLTANPVSIQRPEGLLFIVVGLDGPAQFVQLQWVIFHASCRRIPQYLSFLPGAAHMQGVGIQRAEEKSS